MDLAARLQNFRLRLSQPEDGAALAVFRMGFGLIMFYDMIRYGWLLNLERMYLRSEFHFKYFGFEWVEMLPGNGLYWHLSILAVLGLMIAFGLFYRWATILFCLGFGWFFLIDRAMYLNHFYMVWLFSALLCVLPANRLWSLDVKWRGLPGSAVSPVWARWLLLAQLEIILIYAGIVKINPDWLNLAPLEQWLSKRADYWLVGELFSQRWAVAVAAYGVIALHLVGAPLLLFKRTRVYVLWIYASFHSLNHFVFTIGIFPWMTLFTSLLCLDPDWPRRFWRRIGGRVKSAKKAIERASPHPLGAPLMSFIAVWLFLQLFLPVRHFFYPGDVAWNEDGHVFSWRMKLRDKKGTLVYVLEERESGKRWAVNPQKYLTRKQHRKMVCRPDMVLQFGHYLAERWAQENGIDQPAVYAHNRCSLNYREPAPQIDPTVDLTQISLVNFTASWTMPLDKPLPNRIIGWSRVASIGADQGTDHE